MSFRVVQEIQEAENRFPVSEMEIVVEVEVEVVVIADILTETKEPVVAYIIQNQNNICMMEF